MYQIANMPRWMMVLCVFIIAIVLLNIALPSAMADNSSSVMPTASNVLLRLRVGTLDPRHTFLPMPGALQRKSSGAQQGLWLVQFPGPIQASWHAAMLHAGLDIVTYIPDYAYLVWGGPERLVAVQQAVAVRWVGTYHPYYALHPALLTPKDTDIDVVVQLFDHPNAAMTAEAILQRASRILRSPYVVRHYRNLGIRIAAEDLAWLAAFPEVVSIEPLPHYQKLDEIQGQIIAGNLSADGVQPSGPGYLHWLTATVGLTTTPGAYPIVDITDDGIDNGAVTPNHPDFFEVGLLSNADRLIYNHNWTDDALADGVGGHGTLNASIVGGYNDQVGEAYQDDGAYHYGLGINPFGRIGGTKIFRNSGPYQAPSYTEIIATSYNYGARISSNSWGEVDGNGAYLIDDQEYDALVRDAVPTTPGNQEMLIVFAAGNSGFDGYNTIGSPGNAKNIISVGASENYRPTWTDGCGYGASDANNAQDIASFSSRGPTDDERIKPDLVAPGTHIQGAASQIANYTGYYVCDKYHPGGQTWYAASSGTSHATPAVAGAASLLSHYYQVHFGSIPSPAMLKAYLINAARYLDGFDSGDTLPSPTQGYGAVDLGRAFDDAQRVLQDQGMILDSTGDTYVRLGGVADPSKPLRITLAWTDAPGPTTGDAYVNNLDLALVIGGQMYRGNVFAGAISIPGGQADPRNNVENIVLPAGTSGAFTLTIQATNIAGDGVPGNDDVTDQDFALVCYNCALAPDFSLRVQPTSQAICSPASGIYTISTAAVMAFSAPLTLHVRGYPTATVPTFAPNPIPPGASSYLTLETTPNSPVGVYPLDIVGSALTRTHTATVQLNLFNRVPDMPVLVAPNDATPDVGIVPTLVWDGSAQATRYYVEVAANATFSTTVYTATVPSDMSSRRISHTVTSALEYASIYYWRVTAYNVCGWSQTTPVSYFTTQIPPATFCRSPHIHIPDADIAGVSDTLTLPNLGALLDVDVTISTTHTWVGDLVFSLEHVGTGITATLIDRVGYPASTLGCSGDDIDVRLDDSALLAIENACSPTEPAFPPGAVYRPNTPLAAFDNVPAGGSWTLTVSDRADWDTGTMHQWCLIPSAGRTTLAFSKEVYTVAKGEGSAIIAVILNAPSELTVTTAYATYNETAIAGRDYLTSTGVLTFIPGTRIQTFSVPVLDNAENRMSRVALLTLDNVVNATFRAPQTASLVIRGDAFDVPPLYIPLVLRFGPCDQTICLP